MFRTLLFDFDGTLVDSMGSYAAAILRIMEENHTPYPEDLIKRVTPMGVPATTRYLCSLGLPMTPERVFDIMKEYLMDAYCHHIPAKKGVPAAVAAWKREGRDLNVLTASPHVSLDPCMKRLDLWEHFTHVWSTDDFQMQKADCAIYLACATALGVSPQEILFVDDNLIALETAKKAGLFTVGVHDESSAEYRDEIRATADLYAEDFDKLFLLLQEKGL